MQETIGSGKLDSNYSTAPNKIVIKLTKLKRQNVMLKYLEE